MQEREREMTVILSCASAVSQLSSLRLVSTSVTIATLNGVLISLEEPVVSNDANVGFL